MANSADTEARGPGLPRRLAVMGALLVPLVLDPFGADTQGLKGAMLALCGGLALACGALEELSGRRPRPPASLPETVLLLLTGWAALSLLWAVNPELGASRVLLLLGMYGVARGVRAMAVAPGSAQRWLLGLIAVGLLVIAIDAAAILRVRGGLLDIEAKHASWLFVHSNMAASYVTMLAPLIVALMLGAPGVGRALSWLLPLGGVLLYLGLLRSRAGVLGALLGVIVVGVLFLLRRRLQSWRPPRRRWAWASGVLLVGATLLPFSDSARGTVKDLFYRGVSARLFDLNDASFRPLLWSKTIQMVSDRPLTGVGAGNFVVAFPRYERQKEAKPHAHNDALQILSELGVPGLFLFLALLGSTLLSLLASLTAGRDRRSFTVAAGLTGSLLVLVLGGQFEVPFALGATASTTAILIGLAGAERPSTRATATSRPPAPAPWRRLAAALTLLVVLPALAVVLLRLPGSYWLARADEAAERGEFDEALRLYERVASLHTGSYYPASRMAALSLLREDPAAALRHVQRALALWPWGAEIMEAEGDVQARLGHLDEAAVRYAEAVEYSPTRNSAFFKRVRALDEAGHLTQAIDLLQYRVSTHAGSTTDAVPRLADMWRRRALETTGSDQTWALVAARHFYAVLLQEGDMKYFWDFNAHLKDVTHRLQRLPGGLKSWWPVYQRFLEQTDFTMPNTALHTSLDADDKRLSPGWLEPEGPPIPGAWRHR